MEEEKRDKKLEKELRLKLGDAAWVVQCYEELSSTMDQAKRMLPLVSPEQPGVVISKKQHAGRGTHGRNWINPARGLLTTFIFPSKSAVAMPQCFSLISAVAVHKTLLSFGCKTALKWPNDIYSLDLRKVGGVLLELLTDTTGQYILCGIGINLEGEPKAEVSTTSVQEICGKGITESELAALLAGNLWDAFRRFEVEGFASFREAWLAAALFIGKPIRCELGSATRAGVFEGIDEYGQLLLREADGIRVVNSGRICF